MEGIPQGEEITVIFNFIDFAQPGWQAWIDFTNVPPYWFSFFRSSVLLPLPLISRVGKYFHQKLTRKDFHNDLEKYSPHTYYFIEIQGDYGMIIDLICQQPELSSDPIVLRKYRYPVPVRLFSCHWPLSFTGSPRNSPN